MATVTSVTKHFATAKEGFTTTLASTISSGAVTVPLNSVSGYSNGEVVALVIEPTDTNKKQVFTGTVDTAGVQITGVVWTEGTNQTHNAGVTVVDYWTATHQAMMVKGIKTSLNDDGTFKTGSISSAGMISAGIIPRSKITTGFNTELQGGWMTGDLPAVSSVTNNGNRSYDVTFASTVASLLSPGMRIRTTRTVTAPTQCTSLNGTTQYYSKASPNKLTFTDDFVVSAWVKLSSYATGNIVARYNGTSGFSVAVTASGQVQITGYNGGAANYSLGLSYQSLPLNKWVHVAAQLDMSTFTATSTTSYVMIDGVDVPIQVLRAGTNPTALIQAGDLQIGAANGVGFFPGKIAQVAVFNAKVTQATMRGYISQGLSGSETSLASAYSFSNSITDLNTTTPNDLTANGSAVATNADSPFGQDGSGTPTGSTDVWLIQSVSTTTVVAQVPEGCTIPTSGGISATSYSTAQVPFGFTLDKGRWEVGTYIKVNTTQSSPVQNTWYNLTSTTGVSGGSVLTVPVGAWAEIGYKAHAQMTGTTNTIIVNTLSTANNTESDIDLTERIGQAGAVTLTQVTGRSKPANLSSATPYYLNTRTDQTAATNIGNNGGSGTTIIKAVPAGI